MILRKNSLFIFIIVASITIISCAISPEKGIKAVKLSWKIPVFDKQLDTIFNMEGSNKMFFYKDLVLYKKEDIRISNGKSSRIFYYWIYKSSNSFGLKYNLDLKNDKGTKFNVDSFLVRNAFKNNAFYDKNNDSLVNIGQTANNFFLLRNMCPRKKLTIVSLIV